MSSSPNTSMNRHSDNLSNWSHISCNLLESWINDPDLDNKKLIIIDSRPANDFNTLHIKNALSIAHSRIMKRRLQTDKISINELLIKNFSSNLVDNQFSNIVVYDNNSEHTNQLDGDSFAFIILTKLVQRFQSVSFLSGGFVCFQAKYGHLCESSPKTTPGLLGTATFPPLMSSFSNYSASSSATSSTSNSLSSTPVVSEKLMGAISSAPPIGYYLDVQAKQEHGDNEQLRRNISSFHHSSEFGIHHNNNNIKSNNTMMTSNLTTQVTQNENYTQPDPTQDLVIREPTKILDFLYLGSQEDALSQLTMNALNITCVLNVSQTCPKPTFISDAHFLRIPVNDGHSAQIMPFFDVAFRFIEKCRKANTKVIIHCLAGISRSPTLAIAYLMRYMNVRSDDAYKFVKERRATISPNFNFLGQLYEYERQLKLENIIDDSKTSQLMCENSSSSSSLSSKSHKLVLSELKSSTDASAERANQEPSAIPKFVSQKFPRRKTYIFMFNDAQCAAQQNAESEVKVVNNNPIVNLRSSTVADTLQSPSTALATFDLNSPTNNKTVDAASFGSTHQQQQQQQQSSSNDMLLMKPLPKSFTLDPSATGFDLKMSIEKSIIAGVDEKKKENVLRRPTNFLINSTSLSKLNTPNLAPSSNKMEVSSNTSDDPTPVLFRVKSCIDSGADASTTSNNNSSDMFKSMPTNRLKRPSSFLLGINTNDSNNVNAFAGSFESVSHKRCSVPVDCMKLKSTADESSSSSSSFNPSDFGNKSTSNQKFQCMFQQQQQQHHQQQQQSHQQHQHQQQLPSSQQQQQHQQCQSGSSNNNNQLPTPLMKPKNMILERTFSCTSGDSSASSCSCCSNISSSSSTFSIGTIIHSCNASITTPATTAANIAMNQQQQQLQQNQTLKANLVDSTFNQKKMKLSPLNDTKCSMSSYFSPSAPFAQLLKPINEPGTSSNETINQSSQMMMSSEDLFESCLDHHQQQQQQQQQQLVDSNQQQLNSQQSLNDFSNSQQQSNSYKNLSTSILFSETSLSNSKQNELYFLRNNLTGESVTTPIHMNPSLSNILSSFSDRLTESKSFEALKSLIDNPTSLISTVTPKPTTTTTLTPATTTTTTTTTTTSMTAATIESDEANSDAANSECDEASKEANKKRKKTSVRNMLVSMPSTNTNKSSSSSSKNGSNKNSLNGSIETMISVL